MSAIFGILGKHDQDDVRQMGELLRHRGAKTVIRSFGDNYTAGAIGRDPDSMIHASGQTVVIADATLYNRDDLIESLGDSYESAASISAADVLARLGLDTLPNRLDSVNGDFAFASVDRQNSTISFARDFFGSRPLYLSRLRQGGVAFASEYKALLAVREAEATVDRSMLQYLQSTKRLPVGRTLFKEIEEVPPGAHLAWDGDGLRSLHAIPPIEVVVTVDDEAQAMELIQRHLRESLRIRINDLDTLGLALSGGIDSIALAFLLRELRPDGVIHTFTAGSDHDDHELITAAKVATAIGSVHHEVLTPPNLIKDRLTQLVWHLEDPLARSEALQLFEVGRAAADVVDVLFTAQGADGLFAGMPKYRLLWLADRLPLFRRALEEFYNLTQSGIKPITPVGRLFDYLKYRGQVPRVPVIHGAELPAAAAFPEPGPELINRAASRGLQTGVCQDLHKFDRGFSAFGIESRFPFYDMRLVRAAYTITDRLKIKGKTQKYIFRKAMENIVPDDFRQIAKFPMRMRYDLAFAEVLDEVGRTLLLEKGGARERGLFDEASLQGLFRTSSQKPYRDEAAMRIWTAAATEVWMRSFVDEPLAELSPVSKQTAGIA